MLYTSISKAFLRNSTGSWNVCSSSPGWYRRSLAYQHNQQRTTNVSIQMISRPVLPSLYKPRNFFEQIKTFHMVSPNCYNVHSHLENNGILIYIPDIISYVNSDCVWICMMWITLLNVNAQCWLCKSIQISHLVNVGIALRWHTKKNHTSAFVIVLCLVVLWTIFTVKVCLSQHI